MSNEIFGVDIAAIITDAFTGNLHPLTLYQVSRTVDAYGATSETSTTHAGEGVRGKWKTETMVAKGWPTDTAKVTFLQSGLPTPEKGDQIEILGERFRILDLSKDPVNATWIAAATLEIGA